jgi:hypothetical protein
MNTLKQFSFTLGIASALAVAMPPRTEAAVSFTAASAELAASVTFSALPGSLLQVVLTNTSVFDTVENSQTLTGVFFSGLDGLTSVSATLSPGSTVIYDDAPAGGVVGGEWAYESGFGGGPGGATGGIQSTGALGAVFGQPNFPGVNLGGPLGLDGLQYGIVSANDDPATGNGGFLGTEGLIKNSVTFVLGSYAGGDAGLAGITNVSFQYGTTLNTIPGGGTCPNGAPNFPICSPQVETPEPMSMAILGIGLAGLGVARMRRRQA